jgi:hypothetical protein
MSRFVNTMHDELFKTFLYYFHNLLIVYHEVSTNLMIFKLHLHFIQLKNISKSHRFPYLTNKMFEISTNFMDKMLKWTQLHEYHFSMNFTL